MKTFSVMMVLTASLVGTLAFAGEIDQDNQPTSPQGVVVRVDAVTQDATIYKVDGTVQNDQAASKAALSTIAQPQNVLASVQHIDLKTSSELDADTSTQAWVHFRYGNYWAAPRAYSYPYFNGYYNPGTYFNYYYNPYSYYNYNWNYSYNYGGYNWHWYRRR